MKLHHTILVLTLLLFSHIAFARNDHSSTELQSKADCIEPPRKQLLNMGWNSWHPYTFIKYTQGNANSLVGLDVDLESAVANRVGIESKYREMKLENLANEFNEETIDFISGATYSNQRAQIGYFSIPYRFEENSLFVLQSSDNTLQFDNTTELLAEVRMQNFRLGVVKGYVYIEPQINQFIRDVSNSDVILQYDDEAMLLNALIQHHIDGFIADRIAGSAAVLDAKSTTLVAEIKLQSVTPIHFLFNKKTVPLSVVDQFNQEIKNFQHDKDYKAILKKYIYPVMLLQILDAKWFYILGVIGTIAFAISGVAVAAQENTTLFGAILLALMPSIGGGVMRDVILNRDVVGIILTPSYIYYVIIVVLIGFATIRLLSYYNRNNSAEEILMPFWNNLIVICDSIGQAAFIVTGVTIVVIAKIDPIELWGPFFAFLTANGGGILRDLMRKDRVISCIADKNFGPEISIIWGLIFSIFLELDAYNMSSEKMEFAVFLVVIGAIATNLFIHFTKMLNIKFYRDMES